MNAALNVVPAMIGAYLTIRDDAEKRDMANRHWPRLSPCVANAMLTTEIAA